jgi:hypothetical protein
MTMTVANNVPHGKVEIKNRLLKILASLGADWQIKKFSIARSIGISLVTFVTFMEDEGDSFKSVATHDAILKWVTLKEAEMKLSQKRSYNILKNLL